MRKIPKREDILKTKEDAEMIVVWLEELKKNKGWQVLLSDLCFFLSLPAKQ